MSKPSDMSRAEKTRIKRRAVRRGRWAERRVRIQLRLTGHRILAANYRTPVGEIDLIAQKGNRLSFVEVKARNTWQDAAAAVTTHQRERIQRAAQYFLMQHPHLQVCSIRFDVAWVRGLSSLFAVHYMADAWRP